MPRAPLLACGQGMTIGPTFGIRHPFRDVARAPRDLAVTDPNTPREFAAPLETRARQVGHTRDRVDLWRQHERGWQGFSHGFAPMAPKKRESLFGLFLERPLMNDCNYMDG
jgi:hypothetical protein